MTYQEIFNRAYIGLMKQGTKAMDDDGLCRYQLPDGRRCAVGHVFQGDIPKYLVLANPSAVEDTVLEALGLGTMDSRFLKRLQACHDKSPRYDFKSRFDLEAKELAKEFGLTVPEHF